MHGIYVIIILTKCIKKRSNTLEISRKHNQVFRDTPCAFSEKIQLIVQKFAAREYSSVKKCPPKHFREQFYNTLVILKNFGVKSFLTFHLIQNSFYLTFLRPILEKLENAFLDNLK